ncbi:MAG: CHAT domain-containing tetratricopeptide repeat protein [Bacteroidota bacterium]
MIRQKKNLHPINRSSSFWGGKNASAFTSSYVKAGTLILFLLISGWGSNPSVSAQSPTSCQSLIEQIEATKKQGNLQAYGNLLEQFGQESGCTDHEQAALHLLQADYHWILAENKKAAKGYQQALDLSSDSLELTLLALLGVTKVSLLLQEFEQVEENIQQIYQLIEGKDGIDPVILGKTKFQEGRLLTVRRQDEQGLEKFLEAVDYFSTPVHGDSIELARTWGRIGYTFIQLFELDSAEKYLTLSFDWQKSKWNDDHLDLALTYLYLGQLSFRHKDHGRAENYFNAALRIRQQILGEDHIQLAFVHNMLGLCHYRGGNFEKASISLEKALNSFREEYGESHSMVGSANLNLGMVRVESLQYEAAIENFLSALRIWKTLFGEKTRQSIGIYNNLGMSYLRLEQYQEALHAFGEAYQLAAEMYPPYHPYPARIASNLARTHRDLLAFPEAMHWHQKALGQLIPGIEQDPMAPLPSTQGPIAGELVEILRHKGETLLFKNEGLTPNQKEVEVALSIFSHTNNLIDSLRLGFREESSKLSYGAQAKSTYEGGLSAAAILYQMTRDPRYAEMAFGFSERSKALVLLEALQLDEAVAFSEVPEEVKNKETELRQEMADFQQQLYELAKQNQGQEREAKRSLEQAHFASRQSYDSLIQLLEQAYPAYFQHKYDLKVASIAETRHILPDSTAWLEYFVGKEEMHLFCLTQDSMIWLRQEIRGNLADRIEQFRQSIYLPFFQGEMPGPAQQYEQHGHDLYQELLAPLIDRFPELPQKWIMVVDGALGYLPFDALLTVPVEQVGKYKTYPYLGKKYQISYAYSATLLRELLSQQTPTKGLGKPIAFAPVFTNQEEEPMQGEAMRAGLGPLPFSQKEVREIEQLIQCKTLLRSEASRDAFLELAPHSRLIHLSTHAKVNDLQSELSCVVFAGPDSLTAHEIAALDLQAELVVLSACETGLGELSEGEGILSLARGFTYAGSQSLLTTLWRVNDAATAGIMGDFYEHLAAGLPKDQALYLSKKSHLEEQDHLLAHPFYWAGYTLMGNPQAIPDLQPSIPIIWYLVLLLIGGGLLFAILRSQIQHWQQHSRA